VADWLEWQHHINFVKPGEAAKPQPAKKTSMLDGTTGWNLEVDLGKKLVFPGIVQTNLRPDIILWSETGKKLIMIELTVPWETRRDEAYERKKAKYTELLIECRERGYRTWLFSIEVGARGFCSESVCRLMAAIGTTGRDRRRTIQRLSQAAKRASSWLGYDERRIPGSYRPPHRKTVGPLAIRYTWIRPEISMTASTMLMMEVDEQNTDHNKVSVPGSLAGGTRGSAQQTWRNWLEANPQQMQENRNSD